MSAAAAGKTLTRAASFWAEQSARVSATWHGPGADMRARYTANCFRELDGFLRSLLHQLAPAPLGPVQRNTANKLGAMVLTGSVLTGGLPLADCARLRAIGRSAACLLHCRGWVRRADVATGGWMTAGWPDAEGVALRRYPLGARLQPAASDVADVCDFYLRVGHAVCDGQARDGVVSGRA